MDALTGTEYPELHPLVVIKDEDLDRLLEAARRVELSDFDTLSDLSDLSELPPEYNSDDSMTPPSDRDSIARSTAKSQISVHEAAQERSAKGEFVNLRFRAHHHADQLYLMAIAPVQNSSYTSCPVFAAARMTLTYPNNMNVLLRGLKRPFADEDATDPPLVKKTKSSNSKPRRNRAREAKLLKEGFVVRPRLRAKIIQVTNVINTKLDPKDLPTSTGIYEAIPLHRSPVDPSLPRLEFDVLIKAGYKLIDWDGVTPRPLLDSRERVAAVLAGRPNEPDFLGRTQRLFHKMTQIASKISFSDSEINHFHRNYPAVNVGITPGQGAEHPSFTLPHEEQMKELLEDEDFLKLVKFHSFLLCVWCPQMYQRFRECLSKLLTHKRLGKKLKSIAPADVYPRVAFNFGPKAWTNRHRDPKDYALSWCIVQLFGRFNPKLGGHIMFDDLQLVVEFPAGSCILIPSATFLHANLPVRVSKGEERASITQYFPGGLLRYVDHGFRLQSSLKNRSKKIREEAACVRAELWEKDRSMYMTVRELVELRLVHSPEEIPPDWGFRSFRDDVHVIRFHIVAPALRLPSSASPPSIPRWDPALNIDYLMLSKTKSLLTSCTHPPALSKEMGIPITSLYPLSSNNHTQNPPAEMSDQSDTPTGQENEMEDEVVPEASSSHRRRSPNRRQRHHSCSESAEDLTDLIHQMELDEARKVHDELREQLSHTLVHIEELYLNVQVMMNVLRQSDP
ncbi:hypothetical protein NP233_g7132 [Leucocoprinus birnbaumii]|uniref:Uncharacterized protein n=1 Tax=Leucocoprinus birnbaumii TaxID=56174 RepID=A0AAD5VT37_9AGAR|nr:hypothetical protein NP233_g7132 [Leucocoprinus birnbaumii]